LNIEVKGKRQTANVKIRKCANVQMKYRAGSKKPKAQSQKLIQLFALLLALGFQPLGCILLAACGLKLY
jgi:hypothetical protein